LILKSIKKLVDQKNYDKNFFSSVTFGLCLISNQKLGRAMYEKTKLSVPVLSCLVRQIFHRPKLVGCLQKLVGQQKSNQFWLFV
jgi:hypothetical protein